ncbi:DMT family transporter [Paraburkholderia sp.]|uniref:DMT family transporter n=1 Tax=Paraburkholderia sp. TaxID=1926495 RepID=UPI002D427D15|nr:DMT family transporter [Paraburkholderia sp.]HZZ02777.1 DMT family transporter [Paraburkholderia sp.]
MRTRIRGSRLAAASLAFAGCLWGTGFFFGKIAFEEMSVTENVTFRFLFGSVVLFPFLLKRRRPFRLKELSLLLLAGVIGVPVQFLVQFEGLRLTTVSHASLVVATLPMLLAAGSAVFLHERLTVFEWGMLLVSAIGAALIALSSYSPTGPQPTTRGDLLVLLSMVAAAAMILLSKRLIDGHDPLQVTVAIIVTGTVMLLFWTAFRQPLRFRFSPEVWGAVAAQGVLATAGAYLFWNWGLARMAAARSGAFLNLEPIVGTLLGLSVLHEVLAISAVIGGAMIVGSAIFFTRRPGV